MENMIAVVSLVIAALAVFFGPLVQLCIARYQMRATANLTDKQLKNTLGVAKLQIISPIRQHWIDDLRNNLAELISTAQAHWIFPKDVEAAQTKLLLIERKIELMLNPNESDHKALHKELNRLIEVVIRQNENTPLGDFTTTFSNAISMAQAVLKREWQRIKDEE